MTQELDKLSRVRQPVPEPPAPPLAPPPAPAPAGAPPEAPRERPRMAGPREPSEAEQAAKAAQQSKILFATTRPAPVVPPRESWQPQEGAEAAQAPAKASLSSKQAFLQEASQLAPTALQDTLQQPDTPWIVQAGTLIPAVLEFGINSDLPGYLKARVREPVYDSLEHRTILIPQGSVLLGRYDDEIVYGQSRVLIVWTRLLLPNGNSIRLEGMPGVDMTGYAGLRGRVNNHFWPLLRAVLMSSVLSVGSRIPFGSTENYRQNLAQDFAEDFSRGANQAGQQIVRRELNRKPTIDNILPGRMFNVFVHLDMALEPYVETPQVKQAAPVAQRGR